MAYINIKELIEEKTLESGTLWRGFQIINRIRVKSDFLYIYHLDRLDEYGGFFDWRKDSTVEDLTKWLKKRVKEEERMKLTDKWRTELTKQAKEKVLPILKKTNKNLIVSADFEEPRFKN